MRQWRWTRWVWPVGSAAWIMDGIFCLRFPNKQHAVLAFLLGALFAVAGAFFRWQRR